MKKPGFGFKDRKLYLFLDEKIMVLEVWPSLKAVQKTGQSPWEEFVPEFRVLFPESPAPLGIADQPLVDGEEPIRQRHRAFGAFRAKIPRAVADTVEAFQTRQWKMLRLMQRSPAALELSGINPALGFAVANYKLFRQQFCTLEGAAIVAKRRQRDIAEWVGFPGTEAAVRILAKVPTESVSFPFLKTLRSIILKSENRKTISHLSRINAGVVGILAVERLSEMTRPNLLAEVAESREEAFHPRAAEMLSHSLEMLAEIGPNSPLPPQFATLASLQAFHDEITAEFLRVKSRADDPLPEPPIAGTETIVPIVTGEDLREEGKSQKNCVGGYAARIRQGGVAVFRVLRPNRATLSIVKTPDGNWIIGELRRKANAEASLETHEAVQHWLDEYQFSA